jgi:uncharacterized membrane-anchored protein
VLGGGQVFCDWCLRSDGFMRFLVVDEGFREEQGGRLLQRLYEIETYRMMSLLALPIARRMSRDLDEIQADLQKLMHSMDAQSVAADDSHLLVKLTHLAVRVESELVEGLAIGPVVLAVVTITRRTRRRLSRHEASEVQRAHPVKRAV